MKKNSQHSCYIRIHRQQFWKADMVRNLNFCRLNGRCARIQICQMQHCLVASSLQQIKDILPAMPVVGEQDFLSPQKSFYLDWESNGHEIDQQEKIKFTFVGTGNPYRHGISKDRQYELRSSHSELRRRGQSSGTSKGKNTFHRR